MWDEQPHRRGERRRSWGGGGRLRRALRPGAATEAANAAAVEAGYHTSSGGNGATSLGCDRGAPEAFGLEGTQSYAVAVHFATQANAEQAQAALQARDVSSVGVAHVTADCRD